MISLKSAFKHSFHDDSNMYKRQTLSLKKEEVRVNCRRGGGSARWAACGVIGVQVNGSFAAAIDLPRPSGPAEGIATNHVQLRRALPETWSRLFPPPPSASKSHLCLTPPPQ